MLVINLLLAYTALTICLFIAGYSALMMTGGLDIDPMIIFFGILTGIIGVISALLVVAQILGQMAVRRKNSAKR